MRFRATVELNGKTLWKGHQDKGHRAAVAAFRSAVTGAGAPPNGALPTGAMLATMRATLQAADRAGAGE